MATTKQLTPEQAFRKAMAHPIRVRILSGMTAPNTDPMSPARFSAQDPDGVPLGVAAYHFRKMSALGLLELVGTRPRRGATEHFYRVTEEVASRFRAEQEEVQVRVTRQYPDGTVDGSTLRVRRGGPPVQLPSTSGVDAILISID